MAKGKSRHVTPAKYYGKGDVVDYYINSGKYRTSKGRKRTVEDVCDFCKKRIKVKTSQLRLLKQGYKFACNDCFPKQENKEKITREWKYIKK